MALTKLELDAFCENLDKLENDKKEIAEEIKAIFDAFANSNELDKKSVKKFYKEWKECQKDKDEYILVDLESDNLLQIAIPEFATE